MKPKVKVQKFSGGENPHEFCYALELTGHFGVLASAVYTSLHGIRDDDTIGEIINYLTVTQHDSSGRLLLEEHVGKGTNIWGSLDDKPFKVSFSLKPSLWSFFFG